MEDIRNLTLDELKADLTAMGEPPYRAEQVFAWLYQRGATGFAEFTDLPKALRDKLAGRYSIGEPEIAERLRSRDGSEKFLFRLHDGCSIETVLIPSGSRATVCLSTQVGCKHGCRFCASGLPGFTRSLAPSEIVGQVLALKKAAQQDLTNFVFMGMGEPLDNFDYLEKAIRIMNSPRGMAIAARRITVSTSGIVPGIARLAGLDLQINLSLSLHASTDELRSRLMPIARRYPLEKVLAACELYLKASGRMMTLEYILIDGVNSSAADAAGLVRIARRLRAKVNLIAYSPVAGLDFKTPSPQTIAAFREKLEGGGVAATLRRSRGSDIAAACGQLAGRGR